MIKELIPKVDIAVENFTPGVIARMGLGYDVMSAINPGLAICSVSTTRTGCRS